MIFDAHVHLVDRGFIHDDFMLGLARILAAGAGKASGDFPRPESLLDSIEQALFDPGGEGLIATMDHAGIDRSCVFTVDYGLLTGEPAVSIDEQNKIIAQTVRRFPDRLDALYSIDPRRPEAIEGFRRAVEDWGFKGLKIHPSSGFFVSDEAFFPLYQQCQDYGLPLLTHTGGQPAPMKSQFGRPVFVDDVAAAFPDLTIIMAHCGYAWWEEALMIMNMKPNCCVDFSGWQQDYLGDPTRFYHVLRKALDFVGPWRVFFGSDGPYLNVLCPLSDWVAAFRDPANWPKDITFNQAEMDIVLGRSFMQRIRRG